jgi:oxygen-dependent protoporphyrinogen oxidase
MTAHSSGRSAERTGAGHVAVVGGGISGLVAAYAVQRKVPGVSVTLLEGGRSTGGKLRGGEVAGQPVDLGAESILNRRPEAVTLARDVGLADDLVHPVTTAAGIWSRGAVRPMPRTVMGIPADLTALAASSIVGRRAVPRARLERLLPRVDVADDTSVGRLVAHRLGREVRDRLVEPMLGGVYAGRADELSLHATVPQLVTALGEHKGLLAAATALAGASISGVPVFAGVRGGVWRLAEAVDAAVLGAGGTVRCGTTVRDITRVDSGFSLVLGPTIAPETLAADAVSVAVPAAPAARLLRAVAPRASVELGQVGYASMAVVTAAFRAGDVGASPVGSGFLVPPADGHVVKAATFSTTKWGWLSDDLVVVRCSIGRYGEERLLQRDDDELIEAAMLDLREAVGIGARPVEAVVTRWGGGLPQYTVGHRDRVRRIREAVSDVAGLAVCGAAYDGVGIAACVADGLDAATRVVEHLRARDTMQM